MSANAQTAPVPVDANALRGEHFRRLLGKPLTMILAVIVIAAAIVGGALAGSGAIAAGAGAIALLVVLAVVFALADSKAKADFFRAYASSRRLAYSSSRGSLPPVTALLRKGDRRYTDLTLTGDLPGGPNGVLAHYTYEEESTDSEGNRQTSYYHFTVVFCELPDVASVVSELAVQRRAGFRFLDSTEDKFRSRQRVELESDAFDKRYEAFIAHNDDMNKARQIFEPTFIVWLTDHAPDDFAFELVAGALCVNVKGKLEDAAALDGLCSAAGRVARRLAEEAAE
jgi:hypothetical protein